MFPMMKDGKKKIMKYDPYYIIFGNAEIRIRNNEKKVFSNFGLANGVFENYGNGL